MNQIVRMRCGIFGLILCLAPLFSWAEKFEGQGPDPACGGTSLTIEKKGGAVVFIEYAIFGSVQIFVEEFRAIQDKAGAWEVTLTKYSSTPEENGDTKQRLLSTHKFRSDDLKQAEKISAELGNEAVVWGKEPARLIEFFEKNKKDFQRLEES